MVVILTLEAVLAHISRQNLNYLYEKKKKMKKRKKNPTFA